MAVDENENTAAPAPAPEATEAPPSDAPVSSSEPSPASSSDGDAGEPKLSAVDTGKRVDPSLLAGPRSNTNTTNTIRRGPPPGENRGDRKGRREPEVFRKGAPRREGDAAASPPSETNEGADAGEVRALSPRGNGAGGEHGERGARGADRGPRRDRADRPGGDRGPRRDGRDDRPRGPTKPSLDFSDMAPIVVKRDPDEDIGNFAQMLAETGPIDRKELRVGDKVRATCVHIGTDSVFFEISKTQEAHINIAEVLDDEGNVKIKPGDKVDAFVVGLSEGILLSTKLGKDQIDVGMLESAREAGMPVQGTVAGVNKGGLEITLSGSARGFCPLGQIDAGFVENPQALIGKTMSFIVKEVKENGRNVLLSRRALVEREKKEKAEKTLRTLAVGQQIQGTVTRLQPFGAFVDIGGLDGLIPMSELGWGHVKDAKEVVNVGDSVTVEVKKIDYDTQKAGMPKIGLSLKATQADPFIAHIGDMTPGAVLVGTVKKLEQFGAFVELWPGVQGLVHISEISDRRIPHPKDVLNVDEKVQVRVLDVDQGARRISLSMREAPPPREEIEAQQNAARDREAQRRKTYSRGTMVEGTVDRIESFGVFVTLDPLDATPQNEGAPTSRPVSAMMPASETGTPRGSDLRKAFPIGSKVSLLIIDIDDRGRLKVSKTAREQAEERALVEQYNSSSGGAGGKGKGKGMGGGGGGSGLGTFADLLKGKLGK